MTVITYQLRPGVNGGTVNQGDGQSFDIAAAIASGGGTITVDDQVNSRLAAALDASSAVYRSGTTPGTAVTPARIGALQGHLEVAPAVGQVPVMGADGYYTPSVIASAGGDMHAANDLSELTSTADIARANIKVPVLRHGQCVATTNQGLSGALPVVDGYQIVDNDRVLLTQQTDPTQDGPWIAHTAGWVRPDDFPAGAVLTSRSMKITGGTVYASTDWVLTGTGSITVGTNAQTWTPVKVAASGLPNSVVKATLVPGAPTTGTWTTGQGIIDSNGVVWICASGGAPGTWVQAPDPSASAWGVQLLMGAI